jgi:DNA-directed RNA polymerase specialized sigma24 family protein
MRDSWKRSETQDLASVQVEVDWRRAREFLRARLRQEMGSADAAELDDLAQEACVRLLRALRRERAERLEGLMSTIAHRTWTDHLRRRVAARKWLARSDAAAANIPDPRALREHLLGNVVARIELVVLELFHKHGMHECHDLARAHFDERDWRSVAAASGVKEPAVRKRWSRCVAFLRVELAHDPQLWFLRL